MDFRVPDSTPLAYFRALVESDAQFPLLEAAASLAQDDYPELDVQQVLDEVDQLQARLMRRVQGETDELQRLRHLNALFFQDMEFRGNVNDYYDPGNSFLHVVLHTRRGIPISLAVIWLELAQSLGLEARGVSFPGHFLVKVQLPRGQVVIDPLTGQSLSREALSERLDPFRRPGSERDDPALHPALYLQAAPPREIVGRMLRNLKEIYQVQGNWPGVIAVEDRLIVLFPRAWAEYRDRGLAYAERGHAALAVRDLEIYLGHADEELDVADIAHRLAELRRAEG